MAVAPQLLIHTITTDSAHAWGSPLGGLDRSRRSAEQAADWDV